MAGAGRAATEDDARARTVAGGTVLRGDSVRVLGPYPDLASFCRREYPGTLSCGPRRGDGAQEQQVPGVGRVQVIDVGEGVVAVGLAVYAAGGVYVLPEILFDGMGLSLIHI